MSDITEKMKYVFKRLIMTVVWLNIILLKEGSEVYTFCGVYRGGSEAQFLTIKHKRH